MNTPFDRRQLLKAATLAGLGTSSLHAAEGTTQANAIQQENALPGDRDWQLTRVRINQGEYRTSLIEGYCSHQSISAGETLSVFVSTNPPRSFTLDVYRMGYYGGAGARRVASFGPLEGRTQPVPEMGAKRQRECHWEKSLEIPIPADWTSGVYLGKLTTRPQPDEPYWQSYIVFIVRDQRPADVLFQCSDNTWQAYNRWPVNESLYTHPDGAHAPGVAVSFDRPYGKYCQIFDHPLSIGSGEFLLWEFPLCYWLEEHGYNVTYCSNADVVELDFVTRCPCFLSVGHDEYWDLAQYKTIEAAIEAGTHVLWLSGNSVYMVSEFSASSTGQVRRVIERVASYGPLRTDEVESYGNILGPFDWSGPDERRIIGARSVVPFNGGGDWICTRPDHWIFEGTGMQHGDAIPGLVGWEYHGEPDPEREGLEIVGEGSVWAGGTLRR